MLYFIGFVVYVLLINSFYVSSLEKKMFNKLTKFFLVRFGQSSYCITSILNKQKFIPYLKPMFY